MAVKKIELGWVTVSDLKKAKAFFADVLGLQLKDYKEQWGWMELAGKEGGTLLGVAQQNEHSPKKPGHNAILTLTVDDIIKTKQELEAKGVKFIDEMMEVPGEVKMISFTDQDGNEFQLVEHLKAR